MTILTVEILKQDGNSVTYRGQDAQGIWHKYGPCIFRDGEDPTPANWSIATKIENIIKKREAKHWYAGRITVDDFEELTKSEFATILRNRFKDSTGTRTWKIANRIKTAIQNGEFTTAQLRTAFGLNQAQFNALVTKFNDYADKLAALESAEGE